MEFILVTFCVLKFFRSSDFSLPQPSNIPLMSVTFCVLKFFKSREVSAQQSENM